jgi:hypothetical protein
MPGTGDEEADGAFDIRMIHFLTAGTAVSTNPYWDIVAPSVSSRDGRRVVDGGNPRGSARLAFAEMVLQAAYAYAIPSPETIEWVSGFCGGRPIVELGAGRGYWAAQLSSAGLTVKAFDIEPPQSTKNPSFPCLPGTAKAWHHVGSLGEFQTEPSYGPDCVLFLCWPPGWGDKMASDALDSFEQAGGNRLIYIGEPKGGKTGNDAFFDALTRGWKIETVDRQFVAWWNLADRAQGWIRR